MIEDVVSEKKTEPFAIKTMEKWEGDLNDYLSVGDYVDKELVDHFINVLPPAMFNRNIIQVGEAYSHVNGRATYPTLRKGELGWTYAGNCFINDFVNQTNEGK